MKSLEWIESRDPRHTQAGSIVIVGAHPDDEVIGAGIFASIFKPAKIFIATQGAPQNMQDALSAGFSSQQEYAEQRKAEKLAAMRVAGLPGDRSEELPFVDQDTPRRLSEMARVLEQKLRALKPDWVLTHPYEGGHPDHDSTAFAVHAACELIRRAGGQAPTIVEFTSYHFRAGNFESGVFLAGDATGEAKLVLSDEEKATKQRMFDCFVSQATVLAPFTIGEERFRLAPRYDFSSAPHQGTLYYETKDWAWTGDSWRSEAGRALTSLGLSGQSI